MDTGEPAAPAVLIVDDEPVNRMVLARMVEHFGGAPVEASGGAEALALLAEQDFDLVLMDIHMPQMSGVQAVERLRATPGPNCETPVVAVTGDTTRALAEYAALGFDGYQNKPISLASVQLMMRVRRARPPMAERRSATG